MRHCSSSETLKQIEQNLTRALTSSSPSARRRTSTGSACSRWNAMRCAPLGPTPGSLPSSSMRSWTMPSYNSVFLGEAERAGARIRTGRAEALHAARERPEGVGGQGVGLGLGVAIGGDDQVAEVAQVVVARAVEAAGLDLHLHELTDAVDADDDSPTSDRAVDARVGQLLLGALELLLHLLRLLQQALQVEPATSTAEGLEGV